MAILDRGSFQGTISLQNRHFSPFWRTAPRVPCPKHGRMLRHRASPNASWLSARLTEQFDAHNFAVCAALQHLAWRLLCKGWVNRDPSASRCLIGRGLLLGRGGSSAEPQRSFDVLS